MTLDQWNNQLSPKNRWDVLVAMRGPDCRAGDTFKWFSTSILRHEMREIIRVGGMVNNWGLKFVIVPYNLKGPWNLDEGYISNFNKGKLPKLEDRIFQWDFSHFFQHICEAATVLDLKVISFPAKIWTPMVMEGEKTRNYMEVFETAVGALETYKVEGPWDVNPVTPKQTIMLKKVIKSLKETGVSTNED